jgi:hypothetical protein
MCTKFWLGRQKERNYLDDQGINRDNIKINLRKVWRVCIGFKG